MDPNTAIVVITNRHEPRRHEILRLAKTAGFDVVHEVKYLKKKFSKYLIGKGKVNQIREMGEARSIKCVIFEDYLTSSQVLNLETALHVPVMDKFDLILNVFEMHSPSREAKLQIELARLKRKLPYIKLQTGRRVREDHPGFGSSGEYIVHSTITAIYKRIKNLKEKLDMFQIRQDEQSRRRREMGFTVSLVGYTNAGKTTLLNIMSGTEKTAKDELFTTLSAKTASVHIAGEDVFLTDTIGFIRNLPHELIYAFRATLGEIKNSDLILMVIDSSEGNQEFLDKIDIVKEVIFNVGAGHIPIIFVLNKIDIADDINFKKARLENCVEISSKTGQGMGELKEKIREHIFKIDTELKGYKWDKDGSK